MIDPELLKLARQARTALVVIAVSCGILAVVNLLPLLGTVVAWLFASPNRAAYIIPLGGAAAVFGIVVWAMSSGPSNASPQPKVD